MWPIFILLFSIIRVIMNRYVINTHGMDLQVEFPSLETLKILHMMNLKIIWHDKLAKDSFFKLQSLFVKYCEHL